MMFWKHYNGIYCVRMRVCVRVCALLTLTRASLRSQGVQVCLDLSAGDPSDSKSAVIKSPGCSEMTKVAFKFSEET